MKEHVFNQKCSAKQTLKEKKKQKFQELSTFWKGTVIGLSISTIVAIVAAIGYFMENIYPPIFILAPKALNKPFVISWRVSTIGKF